MDFDRFTLFYGPMEIGTVFQVEGYFSDQWGHIALGRALVDPQTAEAMRLAQFIALNRESTRLWENSEPDELSAEKEAVTAELEAIGHGLFDSEDWCLVNILGHRLPILCPVFRDEDEIEWQWNSGTE